MAKTYRITEYKGSEAFPFHIGEAHVDGVFHEHTHDFVELVVILGGSASHVVNGRPYKIASGDVFVFNVGALHAFEDARELDLINVMYSPMLLSAIGADVRALAGFQAMFVISPSPGGDFRCMMRLDPGGLETVRRILIDMTTEHQLKAKGYQTVVKAQLTVLITFLSRRYSHTKVRVEGHPAALRLADAVGHMGANYRGHLTLDGMAAHCGLSRRHFSRLFHQLYGTTPARYVLDLRLERAAVLLREDTTTVTGVSFDCGFNDSNYFSRQFRRKMGMSPREYRRRSRNS